MAAWMAFGALFFAVKRMEAKIEKKEEMENLLLAQWRREEAKKQSPTCVCKTVQEMVRIEMEDLARQAADTSVEAIHDGWI